MNLKVHTSACKMRIYVPKEFSSFPYNSVWIWKRNLVGSIDILELFATGLSTLYQTEHCQRHLFSPYWQMLGWRSLMVDTCVIQDDYFNSISAVWSLSRRSAWRSNIVSRLLRRFDWRIFDLVQVLVYTAGCSTSQAAAFSFVNYVLWFANFDNSPVL